MAIDHSTVDQLLALGTIASPIVGGIVVYLMARVYRGRDGHVAELTKQGDRLNRQQTEIRHLQKQTHTQPFDHKWDR